MTVEARLADGTVLQFPDGTDPSVVQKVVKQKIASANGPKTTGNPLIDAYHAMSAAGDRKMAAAKDLPGPQIPDLPTLSGLGDDVGHAFMEGARGVGGAVSDSWNQAQQGKPGSLATAPRIGAGVAAMALSPLAGAQQSLITRPVSQATGLPEADVNMALMGATAKPGLNMAPAAAAPRVPHPTTVPGVSQSAAQRAATYVSKVSRGLDPAVLEASSAPTAAEALGKPGETALAALGRRTGATPDALAGDIAARVQGRSDRLQASMAEAAGIHPDAAAGDIEAFVRSGRARAAPLYEEAYAQQSQASAALDALVKRPSIQSAMSRAVRIAAEEGRDPAEIGFKIGQRQVAGPETTHTITEKTPGGGTRDRIEATAGPRVVQDHLVELQNPTPQTYDYVKRGLDDILESYRDKTTGRLVLDEHGRAIQDTLSAFRKELVDQNPAYGAALANSGEYLSAHQAFRDGAKFLTNGQITEAQFADKLGRLTPASREAFKGGIANQFFDLAQNGKLDPKVLKTPRVRAKLSLVLGEDQAAALIASAEHETKMQAFERFANPAAGSQTQPLKAAMDEQDAGGGFVGDFLDRATQGQGLRGSLTGAIANRAQGAAANLRTPGMSIPARDEAGRLLMMSPRELAEYLKTVPKKRPLSLPAPKNVARGYVAAQPLLQKRDQSRP